MIDKMEVLEYWKIIRNKDIKSTSKQKFPCEKWVQITDQERKNLIYLNMFKHFKWFQEYRQKSLWQSFSNEK